MALSDEEIKQFRHDGMLRVADILTDADLAPVIAEVSEWIDARARHLLEHGEITDLCADAPFEKRLGQLYHQSARITEGMDIMQYRGTEIFKFLRNDNLLDALESLFGSEITCNPIQHLRGKPPAGAGGGGFYNVPWHQDAGVTQPEADDSDIITVWLPLVDVTEEMGCMEIIPGVTEKGYLRHHAGEGGTTIVPELLPDTEIRVMPCRQGSVILMDKLTPHRSTPNHTDRVRWSLDLRFQPTGQPTGRPQHPDFIVRSRSNPASVLTDHAEWCRLWDAAKESSKGVQMHRV